MAQMTINKAEHGVIRVFAISRPIADMARALKHRTKPQLATDLLGAAIAPDHIELFPLSDLTGVGLPRYLMDGYDIDEESIRADRVRLDGLDGYVLLLFSNVSDEGDVTLHPSAELTLIGTYSEPQADRAVAPIEAASAKPYSGTTEPAAPVGRSRVGSALTAAGIALILLLIWWILR